MRAEAKTHILPIVTVDAKNGHLSVGDTVRFDGSEDTAKIEGFGFFNGKLFMAFDNEHFGEHAIDTEDIFKI